MACLILLGVTAVAENAPIPLAGPAANVSLRNEVNHGIARGLDWLEKNQQTNGCWSSPDHPAVTALALTAFLGWHEAAVRGEAQARAVQRGFDFILACSQADGGLYRKELPNYNTAICLTAISLRNRPEDRPLILSARRFLIGLQRDFDEPGKTDNVFDGGIGYGSKYQHSDMGNTAFAIEALHFSRLALADQKPGDTADLNWAAAIHFLERCQNLPSHNPEKWASDDPANKGGFIYYPGNSMAGETNLPSGRVALRSYGSISYAGLLSYIYADLKNDDPRVVAVADWLTRNYTLEENPGMGPQGLFYYFHTMSKALTALGTDAIETGDGKKTTWREPLALRLLNLQRTDGSWANDNARWWEKDPALATAYAVIALEMIGRKL